MRPLAKLLLSSLLIGGAGQEGIPPELPHEGHRVAGFADFDGDGSPDYLLADPDYCREHRNCQDRKDPRCGAIWIVSGVSGQRLWTRLGSGDGERLGSWVEGVGDVDGDGATDYAVGSDSKRPNGGVQLVISGKEGSTLLSRLGVIIGPAGDLNGDGHADLFVGETRNSEDETAVGRNLVLSGATREILLEIPRLLGGVGMDRQLGTAGDVDGDSIPDLFILDRGKVWILSGESGALLEIHGKQEGKRITSFLPAGDLDGDGLADSLIGCSNYKESLIVARSGADGSVLYQQRMKDLSFGRELDGLDDLNGDGIAEFATHGWSGMGDPVGVMVLSGVDGSRVFRIRRAHPEIFLSFAFSVAMAGDVDGDGTSDLLVGEVNAPLSGLPMEGSVRVCSGRTGRNLRFLAARDEPRGSFPGLRGLRD